MVKVRFIELSEHPSDGRYNRERLAWLSSYHLFAGKTKEKLMFNAFLLGGIGIVAKEREGWREYIAETKRIKPYVMELVDRAGKLRRVFTPFSDKDFDVLFFDNLKEFLRWCILHSPNGLVGDKQKVMKKLKPYYEELSDTVKKELTKRLMDYAEVEAMLMKKPLHKLWQELKKAIKENDLDTEIYLIGELNRRLKNRLRPHEAHFLVDEILKLLKDRIK